jgi:peroxiredoxin
MEVTAIFFASYVVMWLLVIVMGVLLLLLYRHFGMMALGTAEGVQRDGLAIGEIAPEIELISSIGQPIVWRPPEDFALLFFGAPNCAPCASVLPDLKRLLEDRPALATTMVVAGDADGAALMADKYQLSFPCLADPLGSARKAYRVRVSPFAFVIGQGKRVLAKGLASDVYRVRDLLVAAGLDDGVPPLAASLLTQGVSARAAIEQNGDSRPHAVGRRRPIHG